MLITHSTEDTSLRVFQALRAMRESGDHTLTFEPGRYDFYPDLAGEYISCISNHDNDGYKKVGLPLIGFDGITVEGNGAAFVFHDIMLPVEISASRNVILRDCSIDYEITQYGHATVLEADAHMLRIRIWDNTPFEVVNHSLKLHMGGKERWEPNFFLDIDASTDMITSGTYRTLIENMDASIDPDDPQVVTLRGEEALWHVPAPGNTICLHFGKRWASGVFIQDSENVTLENVTVHHCLGMAVLAQLTENITLKNLQVTPSEGRYVSAYADATHFVNCRGQILLEDCLLEKHFDDCLNCHGIYMQINRFLDRRTVLARLVHPQQLGLQLFRTGERVELINHDTLLSVGENVVTGFELLSRNIARITFERDIGEHVRELDCIESIDACPDLTVRGCTMRKAFPRGLLITTRGHVLVENNSFNTVASAIHISGDSNLWFESGCVRDVTIRNNFFDGCGAAKFGGRSKNFNVINIAPEIPHPDARDGYYHKNITITGNRFRTIHENVLRAISAENLTFRDNVIDRPDPVLTLVEIDGDIQV